MFKIQTMHVQIHVNTIADYFLLKNAEEKNTVLFLRSQTTL